MAIEVHKDPKTRKEYILATGKVDGVYINPLKEVKTYSGKNGPWTPTHSVNIVVDGTRISLGLTEKETVRAKDVNDQYQDVERGAEVSVVVEENGEYKGVKQYQARTSGITVIEDAPKSASPQAQAIKQSYSAKKDNTPIIAGNARTAAFEILRGQDVDFPEDFKKVIKELVVYSDNKRKQYAEANPDLDDFQVGVSVGQSVVLASSLVSSVDDLDPIVDVILNDIVPFSVDAVKALDEKLESKPVAKKTVLKKTPTKESVKVQEESNHTPPLVEDDTDCPV